MQRLLLACSIIFSMNIHCSIQYIEQEDKYTEEYGGDTMVVQLSGSTYFAYIISGDRKVELKQPEWFYQHLKDRYTNLKKVTNIQE
jgi:hypothetical protein